MTVGSDLQTIAIIGGSGFVGTHLCNQLTREGYDLRVLTRRRARSKHLTVYPTLKLIEVDCSDAGALRAALQGADAVINLVGILNEKGSDGSGFRAAHVTLLDQLIQACRACGIRRFLQMSALHADAEKGPSHYLRSKGEAERLLASCRDLEVTCFRPSVIFGDGDSFFNRFADLLRLSPLFLPLACAHARFAPVYVGDVCAAFVRALADRQTIGDSYDLCGPHRYTLKTLVEYTATQLGLHTLILELPDALARLQARVLEWVPGKPFTRDNYQSLQVNSICGGESPGLADLGITPRALETVVPAYLSGQSQRGRFGRFRQHAHRSE